MGHYFEGMLVFTFRVGALRDRTGFQILLDEITAAALRALFRDGLAPGDEIAIGITVAPIESSAALGTPLNNLAF